jgi:hypothetical protein
VNYSNWLAAGGGVYAGRGARPLNPKLLRGLVAKPPPPAKPKQSKAYRRLVVSLAESSLRESRMLAASYRHKRDHRADTMVPPLWRQASDPAARMEALRVMHIWHGPR